MTDSKKKASDLPKSKKAKQTKPSETEGVHFLQASLWDDDERGIPNEIVRSALFNARNKIEGRAYLKGVEIATIGDGKITYQGEELRQDDETVWLQLIHMAKGLPPDSPVEFVPKHFCEAIGWSVKGRSYERLIECMSRMQATSLKIYSNRLKEGVSLSMIPEFSWKDDATGKKLSKYKVVLSPKLVQLYAGMHYTNLDWEQRLRLPVGIATWLHGYYASHSKPLPVKVETLVAALGITTEKPTQQRSLIKAALEGLKAVGFLAEWEIKDDIVTVKRSPRGLDKR